MTPCVNGATGYFPANTATASTTMNSKKALSSIFRLPKKRVSTQTGKKRMRFEKNTSSMKNEAARWDRPNREVM